MPNHSYQKIHSILIIIYFYGMRLRSLLGLAQTQPHPAILAHFKALLTPLGEAEPTWAVGIFPGFLGLKTHFPAGGSWG